jgi:CTP:molybdopterin cytidylyltransferase MocA
VGVVLAAGRSERLDPLTRGGSKALLRLGGVSLVERAVRSLLACGLERVLVVVGHDAGPVAAVVGRLARGRVRAVYADRWQDGNGASLAAVEPTVADEALFMLSPSITYSPRERLTGCWPPVRRPCSSTPRPTVPPGWRAAGCGSWTGP